MMVALGRVTAGFETIVANDWGVSSVAGREGKKDMSVKRCMPGSLGGFE